MVLSACQSDYRYMGVSLDTSGNATTSVPLQRGIMVSQSQPLCPLLQLRPRSAAEMRSVPKLLGPKLQTHINTDEKKMHVFKLLRDP